MTLREMAEEYRAAACLIRGRVKVLETRAEDCRSLDELRVVEERIRALKGIWRETRDVAVLLERYYDRGYHRNGRYTV